MKVCKKCTKPFNTSLKLENKRHSLSSRRYCLDCKPFKLRGLFEEIYNKDPKLCGSCNKPIPFKNRRGIYCGRSCAATVNNRHKIGKNNRICVLCGEGFHCSRGHLNPNSKYKRDICFVCKPKYTLNTYTNSSQFKTNNGVNNGLRKYLMRTRQHICVICLNSVWNGAPIALEVDHIDGNSTNNEELNLRLICPNCHAQTPTFKNKNKGNGRKYRMDRYKEGLSY